MNQNSKSKFWFDGLSLKHDTIPCPHCLEPVWFNSPSFKDHELDMPRELTCRNEKCPNFSDHIPIHNYFQEFKFVLERFENGHHYPKKVIKFAKEILKKKVINQNDTIQ